MPLVVPGARKDQARVASPPSETDLMMALATMQKLGRIPTFDERFRGQDLSSLPLDVGMKGPTVSGRVKGEPVTPFDTEPVRGR